MRQLELRRDASLLHRVDAMLGLRLQGREAKNFLPHRATEGDKIAAQLQALREPRTSMMQMTTFHAQGVRIALRGLCSVRSNDLIMLTPTCLA